MELVIRSLRVADGPQVAAAQRVLAEEDFEFAFGLREDLPFADYVQKTEHARAGRDLPAHLVPATFLVGVLGDTLVGRVSIRHRLNERLAVADGHVGYGVLPAFRGRGYATRMLEHALGVLATLGVPQAFVTCDVDNVASRRVIERCGGVYLDTYDGPLVDAPKRRYWVPTSAAAHTSV